MQSSLLTTNVICETGVLFPFVLAAATARPAVHVHTKVVRMGSKPGQSVRPIKTYCSQNRDEASPPKFKQAVSTFTMRVRLFGCFATNDGLFFYFLVVFRKPKSSNIRPSMQPLCAPHMHAMHVNSCKRTKSVKVPN